MKSIPPLSDLFKMTGMEIPSFLGKEVEKKVEEAPKKDEVVEEKESKEVKSKK